MAEHPNAHSHKRDSTDPLAHHINSFSPVRPKSSSSVSTPATPESDDLPCTTASFTQPGLPSGAPPVGTWYKASGNMKETNSTTCTHPGYVSKKLYDALNEQLDEVMSARDEETQRFQEELHESQTVVRKLQSEVNKMKKAAEKVNAAFVIFQGCLRDFNDTEPDQDLQDQDDVPQTQVAGGVESSPQRQIQPFQGGGHIPELETDASKGEKNRSSSDPAPAQDRPAAIASPTQQLQDPAHLAPSSTPAATPTTNDVTPVALPRPSSSREAGHQKPLPSLTAEEFEREDGKIRAYCTSHNSVHRHLGEQLKAKRDARERGEKTEVANKGQPAIFAFQETLASFILNQAEPLPAGGETLQSELKLKTPESLDARPVELGKRKREVSLAAQGEPAEGTFKTQRLPGLAEGGGASRRRKKPRQRRTKRPTGSTGSKRRA